MGSMVTKKANKQSEIEWSCMAMKATFGQSFALIPLHAKLLNQINEQWQLLISIAVASVVKTNNCVARQYSTISVTTKLM